MSMRGSRYLGKAAHSTHASIVDQQVNVQIVHAPFNIRQPLRSAKVRHEESVAFSGQVNQQLRQSVLPTCDRQYRPATVSQRNCKSTADALAGAGDDGLFCVHGLTVARDPLDTRLASCKIPL